MPVELSFIAKTEKVSHVKKTAAVQQLPGGKGGFECEICKVKFMKVILLK